MKKFTTWLFPLTVFVLVILTSAHRTRQPIQTNAYASDSMGVGTTAPEATPTLNLTPTGVGSTAPTFTPTPAPDTVSPVIQITYPANGSRVSKNQAIVITADATDNVQISNVEFYINNVSTCIDALSPYSCSWFVPKKPNVSYTLKAVARDTSNNIAQSVVTVVSR